MIEFLSTHWVVLIILMFVLYQIIDHYSFKRCLDMVGKRYCDENKLEFVGIKHAKGHFSIVLRENGQKKFKKFRMNAVLGKVTYLEWLD